MQALFVLFVLIGTTYSFECIHHLQNYDVTNLTRAPVWGIKRSGASCLPVSGHALSNCILFLSFCSQLNETVFPTCSKSSACITNDANYTSGLSLARTHTANPFVAGVDGMSFTAKFPPGAKWDFQPFNVATVFECDESAVWNSDAASKDPSFVPANGVKSILFDDMLSAYQITFMYAGACPSSPVTIHTPIPTPAPIFPTDSGIGAFWIIFIILIVGFAMYWMLGVIYNYVRGAQGMELVPNRAFWCIHIPACGKKMFCCSVKPAATGNYDNI